MRARLAGLCLILFCATPAVAQVTTDDLQDPGPRDPGVQSAARWQGVDDQIRYLRPGAAFSPDAEIEVRVPPRPKPLASPGENRLGFGIIFGVILFVVVVAFFLYGNRINVSFGRTSEKRRDSEEAEAAGADFLVGGTGNQSLEEIASIRDRRQALILMVSRALERAAGANDLRLARAQTARDVLRTLPRQWGHFAAMRRLVREAEIVHFGGRDISETTFQDCLAAARPIFAASDAKA